MLLNDFFHITDFQNDNGQVKASLVINRDHSIFEGHFPGQPVVPGVCMMQMIKEVLENVTDQKTNLTRVPEMKFLAVIDPVKNNLVEMALKYLVEEKTLTVSGSIFNGELVHFKFKGRFEIL